MTTYRLPTKDANYRGMSDAALQDEHDALTATLSWLEGIGASPAGDLARDAGIDADDMRHALAAIEAEYLSRK